MLIQLIKQNRLSILLILFLITLGAGCGGGLEQALESTSTLGNVTLTGTVEEPIATSISVPILASTKSGLSFQPRMVTTQAGSSYEVFAEPASGDGLPDTGDEIAGVTAITAIDGTYEAVGFTETQVAEGVRVIATNGDHVVQTFYQATEEETQEFLDAGTFPDADINPATDFSVAVLKATCENEGGDLTDCGDIDKQALMYAAYGLGSGYVQGEYSLGSTETIGDNIATLMEAHATALLQSSPDEDITELTKQALLEDTSGLVAVAGETISDVPVTEAAANAATGLSTLADAYCTKDSAEGTSTIKDLIVTDKLDVGHSFDVRAIARLIGEFDPSDIMGNDMIADFRTFALNLTQVNNSTAILAENPEARKTFKDMIKIGSFEDANWAPYAMGFAFSTFPKPTIEGNFRPQSMTGFASFSPTTAALAANNLALDYYNTSAGGSRVLPTDIVTTFNDIFLDAQYLNSAAFGGKNNNQLISQLVANGTNYDFESNVASLMKNPPGASCSTTRDCLLGDQCVTGASGSLCTAISTTIGKTCTLSNECSVGELCMGRYGGGFCMSVSGAPTGAPVLASSGSVQTVGTDYLPPNAGEEGGGCGSDGGCNSGICTDGTQGICTSATYKRAVGAQCGGDLMCESNKCSRQICVFSASSYTEHTASSTVQPLGSPCSMNYQCQSYYCNITSRTCDFLPTSTNIYSEILSDLKADGSSCTDHSQCGSHNCEGGICIQWTGATTGNSTTYSTGLTNGTSCTYGYQCTSGFCMSGNCTAAFSVGYNSGTACTMDTAITVCTSLQYCVGSDAQQLPVGPNITGQCITKIASGGTCGVSSQCASGLSCTSGTCQASQQPQPQPQPQPQSLVITLNQTGNLGSKNVTCRFDTDTNPGNGVIASISRQTNGDGTVTPFTMTTVPAGTYLFTCDIDANGNNQPEVGEKTGYWTAAGGQETYNIPNLAVSATGTQNITFNLFTRSGVKVTVNLPASVTNKQAILLLGPNTNPANAIKTSSNLIANGTQIIYSFSGVPAGNYFGWGFVDVTGNGIQSGPTTPGDYTGYHGGIGTAAPGGPTINYPGSGVSNITINFGTL